MGGDAGKNIISEELAKKLIRAHDGNMALLCIWLSLNSDADMEKAAEDLCLTKAEVESALEKLGRLGVCLNTSPASSVKASGSTKELKFYPEAESLPQYTSSDIRRDSENGGQFQAVVDEAMRIFGRTLNSSEMTKLFGMYDHLALPPEVIIELLNYCTELTVEKYGTGRRASFSFIEKEAYYWANNDVNTFESAEAYITKQKTLRDKSAKIKRMFGINDRAFSATEQRYVSSWLEMGFDEDSIYEAYDRTIIKTNSLSWRYLDTIIKTWKDNGLFSLKDINEKDGRGVRTKTGSNSEDSFDVEAAKLIMNQNRR